MNTLCSICGQPACELDRITGRDGKTYREMKCCGCGLAWTDPMPRPAELAGEIYDEDFYEPSMTSATRGAAEVEVVNSMADFVGGIKPTGRFLDVGCGEGLHMALMRERGWDVRGVELSKFAAEHARSVHGLQVFHGSLSDAPFQPMSFDFIQLRHVMEHLTDPVATLKSVSKLLRPGGLVRIDTPSGEFWRSGPGFIFRMLGNGSFADVRHRDAARVHLDPPMHLHCFTGAALSKLMERCDMGIIRLIQTYHGDPKHYPEPLTRSAFGYLSRGLDVIGSKFNLGELLVVYAVKNHDRTGLAAPRLLPED